MAKELKSYWANILIEPASQAALPEVAMSSLETQDFIDEKELPNVKDIFWRNNIVGFSPQLVADLTLQVLGNDEKFAKNPLKVTALGTFFDHNLAVPDEDDFHTGQKIISPYWQVEGEWVDDSIGQFHDVVPVLMGAKLAQSADLKIGQQLLVRYHSHEQYQQQHIEIKGILKTDGAEENQIVMPLATLQQLTGLEGKVQSVRVSVLTVPENDLSRKARDNVEGLDAEEYDR